MAGETRWSMGVCTYVTDGHGNTSRMTVKGVEVTQPQNSEIEEYDYDT